MERIYMSSDSLLSDILIYTEASIQERLHTGELVFGDPQLLTEVCDALTQHADGM